MNKWQTRQTLLQRAKDPSDEQAWDDFVSYYHDFIEVVLRQMRLNSNDIEDIKQEVLLHLWKVLPGYNKHENARFRTWMSHVIRNKVLDCLRKIQKQKNTHAQGKTVSLEGFHKDQVASESEIEAIVNEEWQKHIVTIAIDRIREHFTERTLQAFHMSLEEHSSTEIGQALDIKPGSASRLIKRFKNRLKEEIELLKVELEP